MSDWEKELFGSAPVRTPEQVAHSKGYTEGYLAAEAERLRVTEYLAELTEKPLADLLRKGEPLDADEATRVWHEMHYRMKDVPEGGILVCLYDRLNRELLKGERCAVCGRHSSENYDCSTEC